MAVTHLLDEVTDGVGRNIGSQIMRKVPPSDDEAATDAGYEYKRIHPAAFTLFVPAKDKMPPSVLSPIPSVCVRLIDGSDNLATDTGTVQIQLNFSAWSTGVHGKDVVLPNPDNALEPLAWTGEEADAFFRKSGGGWRDAWNFLDLALRKVESVTNIAGYVIDRSVPVTFGPLAEQESIPDFYPFWFSWMQFTLKYPIIRNIQDVQKFL